MSKESPCSIKFPAQISTRISRDAHIIANTTLTNDRFVKKSGLANKLKKLKLKNTYIYANGRWMEENQCQSFKFCKVIQYRIFKHIKFCEGKGIKGTVASCIKGPVF